MGQSDSHSKFEGFEGCPALFKGTTSPSSKWMLRLGLTSALSYGGAKPSTLQYLLSVPYLAGRPNYSGFFMAVHHLTALGTVKYPILMDTTGRSGRTLTGLPIFTDFFICDSWKEANQFVARSDWSKKAYSWALILDYSSGRLRLLGYICPGCSAKNEEKESTLHATASDPVPKVN